MSLLPPNDPTANKTNYVFNKRTLVYDENQDKSFTYSGDKIALSKDLLTTPVVTELTPDGFSRGAAAVTFVQLYEQKEKTQSIVYDITNPATTLEINHTLLLDDPATSGSITINGSNQIATFSNGSPATSSLTLSANPTYLGGVENFTANPPVSTSQLTAQISSASFGSQLYASNGGLLYQSLGQLYQDGDYINNTFTTEPTLQLYRYDNGNAGNYVKETKYKVSGITHTDTQPVDFNISTNQNLTITADNIDLSSTGRLILPSLAVSSYLDYNLGKLQVNNNTLGGTSAPVLELINNNSTAGVTNGVPNLQTYKSGRNAVAGGDIISQQSFFANDATGTKTEFGRIQVKTENVSAGNQDGTMSIFTSVNGVNSEVFNFNGGQNENNSFRPLDMNGNNIRTSTGNMTIDTTGSAGSGILTLSALQSVIINSNNLAGIQLNTSGGNLSVNTSTTGGIQLTGTALQSASAGGSSGQHLVITLNGTPYKIALLNA